MGAGLSGSGVRLGTPRESMRLVRVGERRAAADRQDGRRSDRPAGGVCSAPGRRARVGGLCGYVLKKDSPSCGLERVKVYDAHGRPGQVRTRTVRRAARSNASPTCRSKRKAGCRIPRLRENFVERVFAYARLRGLFSGPWNAGRTRALSHGAQADSDGAFAAGVPAARASGGEGAGRAGSGIRAPLHRGVHGRPDGDRHARRGTRTCCSTWRATSMDGSTANRRPSCSRPSTTTGCSWCR